MTATIHHGNNLDVLPTFADCTFDAIITDPPYELGFMGKKWDATGIAYNVELWRECLRVLKPGGHLLAFGGTRTYHRMACAIEDAGFEIRDSIHWLYGSGFPKSLDVSKAIDKMDARDEQQARRFRFTAWVRSTGVTARQINEATGTEMGNHYTTHPTQPAIMTREHLEACRRLLGDVPAWVEIEADIRSVESKNFAAREIIGNQILPDTRVLRAGFVGPIHNGDKAGTVRDVPITAPATDTARQWDGWGTALKPAHEPIVLARKPPVGTIAGNVLEWGTGALNINACRIGNEARWPANVIVDDTITDNWARYFYCAKPSRAERNAGLDELPERLPVDGIDKWTEQDRRRGEGVTRKPSANFHPTVKPLTLIRYLCRLITPPDGHILDPFAGSGTTLAAATLEHFHATGIELTNDYLPIIRARIQWAQQQANQPNQTELPL